MINPKVKDVTPAADFAASVLLRYAGELHRYLLRRLRRPQDVDDLAQEVYLRLLRMGDDKCVRKPLAFVYGIAAHVLADFRMAEAHQQERVTFDDDMVEEWSERPPTFVPDELADGLNLEQQIERSLAQLPPTHAAVLLAHKRDGLSYEEVAHKLELSVHTVEKYVTQAKARIRTISWDR